MKFFTRELYQRCQSTDERTLDAASAEWEQANDRYERHVQAIEAQLPPHVREFTSLLLHDARVQSIARQGDHLFMLLHKDIPPRDLVFLDYHLAGEPVIEPFADNRKDWSKPTDFQFDELDLVRGAEGTLYQQSIVFGNGWLMRLLFRDVQVRLAQPIYPVSATNNPAVLAL